MSANRTLYGTISATAPYGDTITKMNVKFTPTQSSTPSLMPETNTVYLTRPTEGTGELMELVGGSVAWNQLCNSSSVTGTSGHKFYLKKSGVESITNTNTFTGLASGTDMVTDLTLMLGSAIADYAYNLEQATAGSGIAWLKSYGYFTEDYIAYSAPTLQSVEATAHVTVGFNQWDGTSENSKWISSYTTGEITSANPSYNVTGYIPVFPNTQYYMFETGSSRNIFYDGSKNAIPMSSWAISDTAKVITTPSNAYYVRFTITNQYLSSFCFNISDPDKNGTYEPYTETTYPLDSDLVLRGIPKLSNGNLYYDGDTYEWDGTVTRKYGTRAYQAGDESLTDAITDGTNTVYKLNTPTTESADPFTAVQTVEDGGTEEFVTTNGVPVGVVGRFANAVPVDGVDGFTVTADDGTTHTYPVTLSEEIYRGYVDMLTGEAVSDMASIAEYNGETINAPWLSSLDVYSAGATPTKGAQVVYPITPEEVTATITGDPTELGEVTSVTSTKGTVKWGNMMPLGLKAEITIDSPF